MVRKHLLKTIWEINEYTDRVIIIITFFYLLSLLLTSYFEVTHYIKITLIVMHSFVGIILLIYLCLKLFLKSPNRRWALVMNNTDYQIIEQWLKGEGNANFLVRVNCKYKLVTDSYLDILTELNFDAFSGSVYEASFEEFKERNGELIKQNKKCFMLMIDPIDGKSIIGYSCLLPLTETATNLYLDGGILDAKMPKSFIAKSKDATFAILIFAIHLKEEFSFAKSGASRKYSLYFWSCIRLHAEMLCSTKQNNLPPLLAQTCEKSLSRRLIRLGFTNTKRKSRDGYDIWKFEQN